MSNLSILDDLMERKFLDLHTAYIGRVISCDGAEATIQPLGGIQQVGQKVRAQAVVSNVPVLRSACTKWQEITYMTSTTTSETKTFAVYEPPAVGSLVLCMCCERDITDTRHGKSNTPTTHRHDLSDSVLVGVLS